MIYNRDGDAMARGAVLVTGSLSLYICGGV